MSMEVHSNSICCTSAGALHLGGMLAARLLPIAPQHSLQLAARIGRPRRFWQLLLASRRRSCRVVLLQLAQRLAALLIVLQPEGTGDAGGEMSALQLCGLAAGLPAWQAQCSNQVNSKVESALSTRHTPGWGG